MTGWKVKNNLVQCSLCEAPVIYLEPLVRQKIELLVDEYSAQEWLGYLVGKVSNKENFFVEDLVIPPHKEAHSASAEAEPFHIPDNCIGIIHSHHSMGAFHSSIDQAYVDKNFPISITVAKKGFNLEFDAVSYMMTPCGKATSNKSTIKYVQPKPLFDTEVFLKEAKENIDKGKRICKAGVPIRYMFPSLESGNYLVDEHGRILTEREKQFLLGNSSEEKDEYLG